MPTRTRLRCEFSVQRLDTLKAVVKTNQLEEEDGNEDEENYFHSSFPTTNRKGIGPGLSAGDPVLNKLNKYKMAPKACILTGNCVEVLSADVLMQ